MRPPSSIVNPSSSPMLTLPPLSLYIHIPWCIKKCPYCDFNSHKKNAALPEAEYVAALIEDLKHDLVYCQGRALHSIFIGGGTPSLFSAKSIALLLNQVEKLIPFETEIEITLEANPGTVEQEKFSDFRRSGINRLSIGIQSFQTDFLKSLGRIHDDKEALNAAEVAIRAGFDNFNLDLMFGLPQQTINQSLKDLETALSLHPTHLSWYQLTIEANTHYYRYPPSLPDEDSLINMQEQGKALLMHGGFSQYEISAFSKAGKQAKHNLNYWLFGDYLGIGAGAHGKLTLSKEGKIIRTRKTRQPNHYLDNSKPFLTECSQVPSTELPIEFMMNALRLCRGTEDSIFEERTGLPITSLNEAMSLGRKHNLLEADNIRPTVRGQQFLNELLSYFA